MHQSHGVLLQRVMEKIKNFIENSHSSIAFAIIVIVTIITANLAGKFFEKTLKRKSENPNIDITSFLFVKQIVLITIYFFGLGWALLTLPISKNFAHSLFAGAGVSTLILGFASQQILGNMMSGIFIIIRRPFRINDTIEVQGNRGKVIEIDLNTTVIENENKDRIIIPNSIVSSGIIINSTKP